MLVRDAIENGGACSAKPKRNNNLANGQPTPCIFSVSANYQRDSGLGICLVLDTQSNAHRAVETQIPKYTQDIGIQAKLDQ